jgi:hypothetical protein
MQEEVGIQNTDCHHVDMVTQRGREIKESMNGDLWLQLVIL